MSAVHREVMSELAQDTHTEAFADGARYALQVAARLESERLTAVAKAYDTTCICVHPSHCPVHRGVRP